MAVLVHRLHTASPADFDLFEDFRTAFDNFFSSQRPLFSLSERLWNPPTDVYETAEAVFIKMEIAGLRDDDIDITVEDNLLRIRGCRREETPAQVDAGPGASERANYHLMKSATEDLSALSGSPRNLMSMPSLPLTTMVSWRSKCRSAGAARARSQSRSSNEALKMRDAKQ